MGLLALVQWLKKVGASVSVILVRKQDHVMIRTIASAT